MVLVLAVMTAAGDRLPAAAGPENIAVVVNSRSWASLAIANACVELRGIPPLNGIYLDQVTAFEQTNVDTFRTTVLEPVLAELQSLGIRDHVDCIAYSADLPTAIEKLGIRGEFVDGNLPQDKPDVAGAMLGTAIRDWTACHSRILPASICEHLTSLGGVMREEGGQTPLTEFLRDGAAGSSGTVTEPYAIQAKFPHPFLHVHYARGCCLAESFCQSVWGPYQPIRSGEWRQ